MNTLLMHCRPGFEGEVCAEIAEHAATLEIPGYAKSKPASAHVEFVCQDARRRRAPDAPPAFRRLDLPAPVGARARLHRIAGKPAHRGTAGGTGEDYPVCGSLWLEVLDTNAGKEVSTFCRKFENRCARRW